MLDKSNKSNIIRVASETTPIGILRKAGTIIIAKDTGNAFLLNEDATAIQTLDTITDKTAISSGGIDGNVVMMQSSKTADFESDTSIDIVFPESFGSTNLVIMVNGLSTANDRMGANFIELNSIAVDKMNVIPLFDGYIFWTVTEYTPSA